MSCRSGDPQARRWVLRWGAGLSCLGMVMVVGPAAAAEPTTQTESAYSFQYGLGLAFLQVRDDLLRPLRWTGGAASIELGLDVDTESSVQRADLLVGVGLLRNRFGHGGAILTEGAHYAYLYRVAPGRPIGVLAGAAYRWETLNSFYYDWDDSFMFWLTTHTLAPAVGFEARPSQHSQFLATVELPIIGLYSRPPEERHYKVDPMIYPLRWTSRAHASPRFAWPGNLFAPTIAASYTKAVGASWGIRLKLDVLYRRAIEPRSYFALGQRLTFQIRHVFQIASPAVADTPRTAARIGDRHRDGTRVFA